MILERVQRNRGLCALETDYLPLMEFDKRSPSDRVDSSYLIVANWTTPLDSVCRSNVSDTLYGFP